MLGNIVKGKTRRPRRVMLYGSHGIGKSTWAAGAPNPIFLATEDGQDDIGVDRTPLIRNFTVTNPDKEPDQRYLTRWYTEEAVAFLRKNAGKKPFFLYLAHTMPHVPVFASEKFLGKSHRGL